MSNPHSESADKIIENRFSTNLVQHVHTEPNATVAQVENDGSVTVWTSTQSVYRARFMLSEALELPASRVRVISTEVGGAFGNKLNSIVSEAVAVLLSKATGKPVKIQLTREEVFSATTTRHPFVIYVKDGVMNDGRLIARQIRAILDGGCVLRRFWSHCWEEYCLWRCDYVRYSKHMHRYLQSLHKQGSLRSIPRIRDHANDVGDRMPNGFDCRKAWNRSGSTQDAQRFERRQAERYW